MKKIALAALALAVLLGACAQETPPRSPYRVVTAVEFEDAGVTLRFTREEKLTRILAQLRLLAPTVRAVPDSGEPCCTLRVVLADGRSAVYRRSGAYLQRGDGAWRRVDAREALRLRLLLHAIPRDG